MIIEKPHHRNRIVKGWAFMKLTVDEITSIEKFLSSGDTDNLPDSFKRKDYSIYLVK